MPDSRQHWVEPSGQHQWSTPSSQGFCQGGWLREQISRYNKVRKTRLQVLAIPNTYFGGDVSVAGLLTGQDYLNVKDRIVGDFAVIPKHTIKSDEPILLDGMAFDELKRHFTVPVYALDLDDFMRFLNAL